MHRLQRLGLALTLLGLGAYGVGVVVPFDGRAVSLTALMVGLTLLPLGGWE